MNRKKKASPINFILGILTLIYVAIAITQQLQRPPEERTWNGKIAGIPYDFRLPTVERIRAAFWNKGTSQIFLPQAFGIGWSINMYPIIHPKEVPELQ
ncbi:MAG TPA: hypothetical protein VIX20_06485 [Ktedonobacteraceae bacterium]